jgi:hypothetical protein
MDTPSELVYIPERRQKPRFKSDYPARIRGYTSNGKLFEEVGRAINLSRSGVYILLNREIPNGSKLSILITFPNGLLKIGTSKLAVPGVVVRGETHSDTVYGIGVKFDDYRFL